MKTIALYNIKGGVGKTASAVNLSYRAAETGARVLLWDLDPQGAASFYFRIKPKLKGGSTALFRKKSAVQNRIKGSDFEGLDILPADFSFRHLDLLFDKKIDPAKRVRRVIKPVERDYDYLIIDCAPSISLVSESLFHSADALVVPTIPTPLSVRTLEQLVKFFRKEGLDVSKIWPFFSMIDKRRRLHQNLAEELPLAKAGFLNSAIPYASEVESMGVRRAPLLSYTRASAASRAYEELWDEIRARL